MTPTDPLVVRGLRAVCYRGDGKACSPNEASFLRIVAFTSPNKREGKFIDIPLFADLDQPQRSIMFATVAEGFARLSYLIEHPDAVTVPEDLF